MIPILARLLAEHQRTPHHMDMCALCRDAAKAIVQPADPVRDQLVAALQQLVSDIQPCLRLELDGDVRTNPGAIDCSTLVPMTPAGWQAINEALAAAGAP